MTYNNENNSILRRILINLIWPWYVFLPSVFTGIILFSRAAATHDVQFIYNVFKYLMHFHMQIISRANFPLMLHADSVLSTSPTNAQIKAHSLDNCKIECKLSLYSTQKHLDNYAPNHSLPAAIMRMSIECFVCIEKVENKSISESTLRSNATQLWWISENDRCVRRIVGYCMGRVFILQFVLHIDQENRYIRWTESKRRVKLPWQR